MLSSYKLKEDAIMAQQMRTREVRSINPLSLHIAVLFILVTPHWGQLSTNVHLPLKANISVLAELERVRNEPSPLVAAQQRLQEHSVDADKFEKLIDNLQVRVGG